MKLKNIFGGHQVQFLDESQDIKYLSKKDKNCNMFKRSWDTYKSNKKILKTKIQKHACKLVHKKWVKSILKSAISKYMTLLLANLENMFQILRLILNKLCSKWKQLGVLNWMVVSSKLAIVGFYCQQFFWVLKMFPTPGRSNIKIFKLTLL